LQYIPHLERLGHEVVPCHFFDSEYLGAMYQGKRSAGGVWRYYLKRFRDLRIKADVIWVEKEALPWFPWFIESNFLMRGVPVVSDYDDAYFYKYDNSRKPLIQAMLGKKIDKVMRHSSIVFAGNPYLAARAKDAGSKRVEIVPTVIDIDRYEVKPPGDPSAPACIGWIGTPETWGAYASVYVPLFAGLAEKTGAKFRIVGPKTPHGAPESFEFLPWSEDTEAALIQGMDIGVMPLPDDPWSRGKCGYKLIQYMACGLPVVASPVGVNSDIVEHGVNGFLAGNEQEWRTALETLAGDRNLRLRMGAEGRRKVERHYSSQVWGPRVVQLLTQP
jgi:glycosyltransferase involved in cell wall biosynthesis